MPDFKPKVAVQLDPPKSDPISLDELAKANGALLCVLKPIEAIQDLSPTVDPSIREEAVSVRYGSIKRTDGIVAQAQMEQSATSPSKYVSRAPQSSFGRRNHHV